MDGLRANGTTLGADCGIGIAASLWLFWQIKELVSSSSLEALFTVDEETGLTGAQALQPGFLDGKILLNLDSEDEGELFIGCAGGIDTTATFIYHPGISYLLTILHLKSQFQDSWGAIRVMILIRKGVIPLKY